MKIFVTGATGYIGGSVAERLVVSGHTVLGLLRTREKALLLKERGIDPVLGTLDDWVYSQMPHVRPMRSFTQQALIIQVLSSPWLEHLSVAQSR